MTEEQRKAIMWFASDDANPQNAPSYRQVADGIKASLAEIDRFKRLVEAWRPIIVSVSQDYDDPSGEMQEEAKAALALEEKL